jgi:cytochrome b subunit of formate dehydrogenase/nitrate/TMAO reductase-like tetraheme cytochrome c subunit
MSLRGQERLLVSIGAAGLAAVLLAVSLEAQQAKPLPGSEPCKGCHETGPRTGKRQPGMPPPFNEATLRASPHATLECTSCHADLAGKEFPHPEKLQPVDCGACHPDETKQYGESLHGKAARRGDALAPRCTDCHGTHNILRPSDPGSPTATTQIPFLCGRCHHEGTPVQLTHNIPQDKILENYTESIHGEGLLRRGLIVTAVCTSCHTAHFVLPHTDPRSSISKQNIARTCTKCHALIATVHRKVIRGELWEKRPGLIPACVDCHEPHKIRRVFYAQGMSDYDCQRCHGNPELKTAGGGHMRSMFVNEQELSASRHARVACVQCHTGGDPSLLRPCATITARVDCSICHANEVEQFQQSIHGQLLAKGSPDGPTCADCHGTHAVLSRNNSRSPTYSRNVPALCGKCHRTGQRAAVRYKGTQTNVVENYEESIHGKGLLQSGLTVTANCADCHTPHDELPSRDPRSSVNPKNVATTCGRCHQGIYEAFTASVHSAAVTKTAKPLPVCSDCHSAHTIKRTDLSDFRLHIMEQCGRCHEAIAKTYFETYHGKVSKLGYVKTARCYDCHGAHDVRAVTDPASRLSRANVVKTCGQCHPGSNRRFAGYLTHATHHDPKKYPILFLTFWGMTSLLMGTLVVAGMHTVAWLPRSLKYSRELKANGHATGAAYVRRFRPFERNLHLMVIASFLGLALTGMMLKFSYTRWAQVLSHLLGGFEAAGVIHRFCAVLTFAYFGLHLWDVARQRRASGKSWRQFIFNRESTVFTRNDWREFVASLKWFVGRGPRPEYGRWTYWEKFDYFAVLWGVAVIGTTGLFLWFPEFFTRLLPGRLINVATIIHSDEALLAVGFIFTVHFFNTHFRPERFPIDTVVFTGGEPLEKFKLDRPREYRELLEQGELEKRLMPAPPPVVVQFWRRFGFTALTIGLGIIALILYAEIFAYK